MAENVVQSSSEAGEIGSIRRDVIDACRDIMPLSVSLVPIAMLFGALAIVKGFSVLETFLMSAIVFAGGSQFAAVELWDQPVPVLTILFSTFLINARHMLMGLSLAPKLQIPKPLRWIAVFFMSDEIWAVSEKQSRKRPVSSVYWFTIAAIFPTTWVVGSVAGALVGPWLGPPEKIGADFAFTAVFIALVVGFEHSRVMMATVIAAGISAALTYHMVGSPWHIMIGAICGIAAAYLSAGEGKRVEENHDVAA